MPADFAAVFAALKPVLAKYEKRMLVKADTPAEYTLLSKTPSPFPQHKGHGLFFGSVKLGKAYVSFHLVPLYMDPGLQKLVSPALKKRMQGKACFNFKTDPDADQIAGLKQLTEASYNRWRDQKWL